MRYLISLGLLLISTAVYASSEEVGFFVTDERECVIENRNKLCSKDEGLLPGDMVKLPLSTKGNELPIRWVSKFAQLEPVVPGKYRVVYRPPVKKNLLISLASDLLGFTRERSSRWTTVAATRGAPFDPRCLRPTEFATLLPGQPAKFSWCSRAPQRIVIMDPTMDIVFAQPVRGLSSVVLNPDELPLVSGITYTWDVIGNPSSGQRELKILDNESAAVVRDAFQDLEKRADLKENEKVIAKASLVQFMSESYPEEVGLSWLSYQLLESLDEGALSKQERGMVRYLKRRIGIRPCGT